MNYQPYEPQDLKILLDEPWEITDEPYKLHAAYALSSLYDVVIEDGEDEEAPYQHKEELWGATISKKQLNDLVLSVAEDFNDAAQNYKPIYIWNKPYPVKKRNAYDPKRLIKVFNFESNGEEYSISPNGVMNLAGTAPDALKQYEISADEAKANRTYLRQIITLAEDDENEGWDKLSDLEVAIYCWALFYHRTESDNFQQFKQEYKDYLYLPQDELLECLNAKSALREKPVGMYAFSALKAKEWHAKRKLESSTREISPAIADDYWYDVALLGNFKPKSE